MEGTDIDGPASPTQGAAATPMGIAALPVPDGLGRLLERVAWIGAEGLALVSAGIIRWTNPALEAICGASPGSLRDTPIAALDTRRLDGPHRGERVELGQLADVVDLGRLSLVRSDGATVAISVTIDRLDAVPGGMTAVRVRGIAEDLRVDEALRTSEARFRALADNAPIGVFHSDIGVRLAYVNARFAEVFGRPTSELLGDRWLEAVVSDDRGSLLAAIGGVLAGADAGPVLRVVRPDGEERTIEVRMVRVEGTDRQASFVGSIEDVTDAIAREATLEWQATHDILTGLPNRAALGDHIGSGVADSDGPIALLFFDLDDFKLINDTLGHQAGDELLQETARRLVDTVRLGDVVARFGGDEFVVFCPRVATVAEAEHVAARVLDALSQPVELAGRQMRITASAGVLVSDPHQRDAEALIRDADIAMYQAKGAGKARAAVFDAEVRRVIEHRLTVVSDLRRAIADGEVDVHYQPIVRRDTLRLTGAEALLRYRHPVLGPIPANEVVEMAETSGCIGQLGAHVLRQACAALAMWRRQAGPAAPDYVTVNIAAAQLADEGFVELVHETTAAHGLEPSALCLELTESQLMTDVERAEEILSALAAAGFRIAIDDFGTGYSSLAYLRRFPVSLVKIERSFVAEPYDPYVAAIIEAVVSVTRAIDAEVVAEGVESIAQLHAVTALGCGLVQGYLFARPVPAADLLNAVSGPRGREMVTPPHEETSS